MNEQERARVEANVKAIKTNEGALGFFKALYEVGMVDGWRAITRVDIKEKSDGTGTTAADV